jgi:hypothetical protein
MPSTVSVNNGKNHVEDVAQENVEKLHRMVLGKDKNINNDYVTNFYVDMAKGVRITQIFLNIYKLSL